MSEADRLWDETDDIFSSWNLKEIPFSERASSLRSNLDQVFTGRTEELKQIFNLLRGDQDFFRQKTPINFLTVIHSIDASINSVYHKPIFR